MRTLILNKFLHRNGGSETYIFKLGEALEQHGHEVQYFGMEHEGRCVGNRVNPTKIVSYSSILSRLVAMAGREAGLLISMVLRAFLSIQFRSALVYGTSG